MEFDKGTPAPVSLTQEQLEVLHQLLTQTKIQKPVESSDINNNSVVSLAKQGKISHSLFSNRLSTGVWIIDTGDSDHRIGDIDTLSYYKPCKQNITVFMADGTRTFVQGTGIIHVVGLSLKSVLYVPNLRCNLLLMSKITEEKNCSVIFSSSHFVFQDIPSGRRIGKAEDKDGLYRISRLDHQGEFRSLVHSSLITVSGNNLMLWHQRLGHPSLDYLRVLYPSVSINKIQGFSCEHCILAKQTRNTHSKHTYKPLQPFHSVHSDI